MASEIGGFAAPGFEPVAAEFERNFTHRGDVGAAFAAVRDGELVVDLWGGLRDRASKTPWERDTLQLIFSGTKGLLAICLLLLVECDELELEAPVARYWPEFDKPEIRVRDVVAHTARLPGIERPADFQDVLDDQRMAEALEVQQPTEDPRGRFCYHALTHGWLCGELVRGITGGSLGRFFANEVAAPLELELWIGLLLEHQPRISTLELADTWPVSPHLHAETLANDELLRSIWGNPPVFARERFPWNDPSFHAAEIPAIGAIGTARSIARLYGSLDRLLDRTMIELATTTLSHGYDEAHGETRRFGVGFELQTERRSLGPPPDAFGHGGAGGSIHGYWPSQRIGFSHAMNLMRDDETDDARGQHCCARCTPRCDDSAALGPWNRGPGRGGARLAAVRSVL
jgi:CubicO group peptidase (beta-lactamase class C family)